MSPRAFVEPVKAPRDPFESAILIGFRFTHQQRSKLLQAGAVILEASSLSTRADVDQSAQLVGVSLQLSEAERFRVEQLVSQRGRILWVLSEDSVTKMMLQRLRPRRRNNPPRRVRES